MALTLGLFVGFQSARDMALTLSAGELELPSLHMPEELTAEQRVVFERALKAGFEANFSTLETMKTSRVLILMGLSATAAMVFLSAVRLRWPVGFPRGLSVRILGGAAWVAAVFRTLDGAQELVVSRRTAEAAMKVLATGPAPAGFSPELMSSVATVLQGGLSVVMIGLLVAVGGYFRSDGVRALFAAELGPRLDDEE